MTDSASTDMKNIARVFEILGLGDPDERWQEVWPITQASFSPDALTFLAPESVERACRHLRMSEESTAACLENLQLFDSPDAALREALLRLAWHFHVSWFTPLPDEKQTSFPELPTDKLGQPAAMFYVYVFLSGIPYIERLHRERAIPEEITLDTLTDIDRWMRKFREMNGFWGYAQMGWLRLHFTQRIYKLGRLQFEMGHFPFDFHAYRNRQTGQVIVLAGNASRFRGDGLFTGETDPNAWIADFSEDSADMAGGMVRGVPISPHGHAEHRQVELPLTDWEKILQKGDPALSVHIPWAGPMDHAECGKSFEWAKRFFPQYHPEFKYRAFECFSWLLDPQYEYHLEPTSNIVQFLKEWYLLPVPAWGDIQDYSSFFDNWKGDLDHAPQRTSLQRATYKHLKAGGHWRVGGSVLFPEDLNWGGQVYRKQ